jgi:hypothetical protein
LLQIQTTTTTTTTTTIIHWNKTMESINVKL